MLVLGRNESDTIIIECPNGDRIEVIHCGFAHGRTKIGFIAPEDYLILRGELLTEMEAA